MVIVAGGAGEGRSYGGQELVRAGGDGGRNWWWQEELLAGAGDGVSR